MKVIISSFSPAASLPKGCAVAVLGWAQLGVLAAQILATPELVTLKAISDYCYGEIGLCTPRLSLGPDSVLSPVGVKEKASLSSFFL